MGLQTAQHRIDVPKILLHVPWIIFRQRDVPGSGASRRDSSFFVRVDSFAVTQLHDLSRERPDNPDIRDFPCDLGKIRTSDDRRPRWANQLNACMRTHPPFVQTALSFSLPKTTVGSRKAPLYTSLSMRTCRQIVRLTSKLSGLDVPDTLAIIAGNGYYPFSMTRAARRAGVRRVVAAAFVNETRNELAEIVDDIEWMAGGQLGRLLSFLKKSGTQHAVMSGQIHPRNLFDLRPDVKALVLLGRLRERNAETIFGAIAKEINAAGIELLPATTYMDDDLATRGLIAGPPLSR